MRWCGELQLREDGVEPLAHPDDGAQHEHDGHVQPVCGRRAPRPTSTPNYSPQSHKRMMCGCAKRFRFAISRRTFSAMSSFLILLRFRILIATLYPVFSCTATAQMRDGGTGEMERVWIRVGVARGGGVRLVSAASSLRRQHVNCT